MKIFISHSSVDQWVARRISQDLIDLGIDTFLDEKDIETGQSIDDTVTDNLRDCDELVLILSPTALRSHWVLIEVGGAKVLSKRVVPILLGVTPNAIPQPISKVLARDINDIEKFYEELKSRLANPASIPPTPPPLPLLFEDFLRAVVTPLKAGDKVRVIDGSTISHEDKSRPPGWVGTMDTLSGRIGVVIGDPIDAGGRQSHYVAFPGYTMFLFAREWLHRLEDD